MAGNGLRCDECGGDVSVVLSREDLRDVIKDTVAETFLTLGIDASDPIEAQKDFQALREWRISLHSLQRKGAMTAVGVAVAGLLSMLLVGARAYIRS